MIQKYRDIGKIILQQKGFSDPKQYKKKMLLEFCDPLTDYVKDNNAMRLICLDLNTEDGICSFSEGIELVHDNFDKVMCFSKQSPNESNIYASVNDLRYLLSFELLNYIENNKKSILKNNVDKTELEKFQEFLKDIKSKFYKDIDGIVFINPQVIQRNDHYFPDIETERKQYTEKKKYQKDVTNTIKKNVNEFLKKNLKINDRTVYSLQINGKTLLDSEFESIYYDILFYYIFEKSINNKIKGVCHTCLNKNDLLSEVSLLHKLYGTTNPLYFDNLNKKKTFNSFCLCKQCYLEIMLGSSYVNKELNEYLFNTKVLIIPDFHINNSLNDLDMPKAIFNMVKIIKRLSEKYHDNIDFIDHLLERIKSFDLLFYQKEPKSQEFLVFSYINSISLQVLLEKNDNLDKLSEKYNLFSFDDNGYNLSFFDFTKLIIEEDTNKKDKKKKNLYKKDILANLDIYLHDNKFDYYRLLRDFIHLWLKKNYKKELSTLLSPFIMNIYLYHFQTFNLISLPKKEEVKPMKTKLENKDYLDYFNMHENVYHNHYYQGLFLLGTFVSGIEYDQKDKNSTILNRINLQGINVHKILNVIALVEEYLKIYSTYVDVREKAYMMECLQGIDKSELTSEEIAFYILSGRSYKSYLGIMYSKNKEIEND